MRPEKSDDLAEPVDQEERAELHRRLKKQNSTMPSSPKTANKWGCEGSRYQANRAFSIKNASSYGEHVGQSSGLLFPADGGSGILREGIRPAVPCTTGQGSTEIVESRGNQPGKLEEGSTRSLPNLNQMRDGVGAQERATRATNRIPLLKDPLVA